MTPLIAKVRVAARSLFEDLMEPILILLIIAQVLLSANSRDCFIYLQVLVYMITVTIHQVGATLVTLFLMNLLQFGYKVFTCCLPRQQQEGLSPRRDLMSGQSNNSTTRAAHLQIRDPGATAKGNSLKKVVTKTASA